MDGLSGLSGRCMQQITAICYDLLHAHASDRSFYVHELDTHPAFRRQGVATTLMKSIFSIAKQHGITQVWLGTEPERSAASKLYGSLQPSEAEVCHLYSYKID